MKDTSAKLKLASETDHESNVSVSVFIFVPTLWFFKCTSYFQTCISFVSNICNHAYILYSANYFIFITCVQASKKIADAKLAKDFQAVLKEFQKAQRIAAERETTYAPFVPQAVLPSRYLFLQIAYHNLMALQYSSF